jgi:hypothetical protein
MDRAVNRVPCCILRLEGSTKHLKLNKQSAHTISLVTQSTLSYEYLAVSARGKGASEDLTYLKGFDSILAGVSGVIAFSPFAAASVNLHEVDIHLAIIKTDHHPGSSYLQTSPLSWLLY